ncbi:MULTISPECIES: glycerophosphodiester phosphodiesterase family protein [Rhodomicrobium]|uniref:glycerophosphodiester phosphodiesterase family protein n=1 Tax=Rhodomicrobium TaxID=1068 RepID=UPI000B4B4608|nr:MULTISPECIES: glycerophosphodiester phosphodiesterase family protein [Rhodomicrobium]
MGRKLLGGLGIVAVFAFGVWFNNTDILATASGDRISMLAHRGVHQTYHRENLTSETCTAERIYPPTHDFLENTLASMEAAFRAGADVVEFDIHPTTDGHFAVLHDWTLDCRTDGKGVTREHTLAELKALDIGYGYTADGGKTYPFRGKGVGLMPTLDEVLERFPDKLLLINIKSNDPAEGELLADRLAQLPPERRALLMAYGGERPIETLKARLPDLVTMSKASLKRCLPRYFGVGWTGSVPEACRNTLLLLPVNIAPWVWGYPNRLSARMQAAGTRVFVTGPYGGGDESASGVDDAETLAKLPRPFTAGIWTNRIETIGPLVKQ